MTKTEWFHINNGYCDEKASSVVNCCVYVIKG